MDKTPRSIIRFLSLFLKVTGHGDEDVVSAITRLLPPLPSHSVDVKVDLTPLIPAREKRRRQVTLAKNDFKGESSEKDVKTVEADVDVKTEEKDAPFSGPASKDNDDEEEEDSDSSAVFGCLSHPREPETARLLPALLRLKTKDSLNLLLKSATRRANDILEKRGSEKRERLDEEGKEEFGHGPFAILGNTGMLA